MTHPKMNTIKTLENIELSFRLDNEGDIILYLPHSIPIEDIQSYIQMIDHNFLINVTNDIIDNIYLSYAKTSAEQNYHIEDDKLIISVTDQKTIIEIIKEFVGVYCKNSEFTERQAEIILKKSMGIILDSTERATYYVNIAKKIQKAKKIVSDNLTELFDN